MTTYQPATPESDAIMRPACPKCGAKTRLVGIEPEKPGHEVHLFECPKCHHMETALAKID